MQKVEIDISNEIVNLKKKMNIKRVILGIIFFIPIVLFFTYGGLNNELAFTIIGICLFVMYLCIATGTITRKSPQFEMQIQRAINDKVKSIIANEDFRVSNTIYLVDQLTHKAENNSCKKMIYIDKEALRFCVVDYKNKRFIIFDVDEMRDYEIYVNDNEVFTGSAFGHDKSSLSGRSSNGFATFSGETQTFCSDLTLLIKLNSIDVPQVAYSIISGARISRQSSVYSECMSTLQEAISLFELVKDLNEQRQLNYESEDCDEDTNLDC